MRASVVRCKPAAGSPGESRGPTATLELVPLDQKTLWFRRRMLSLKTGGEKSRRRGVIHMV